MKKKIVVIVVLFMFLIAGGSHVINAYSPHYLPGGKNYLCEDNFELMFDEYYTIDNFLVKPYTDYTLTVPLAYKDPLNGGIEIYLYDDSTQVDTISIDLVNMSDGNDETNYWSSFTFKTTSETNYMYIVFQDDDFFADNGLDFIQLEEGTVYTGYEVYVDGSVIDTQAPYFQNSGSILSYFDSPITLAEIQSALTAYDAVDGDVTDNITLVDDGYTANNSVLGTYYIEFEVSDSSGNISNVSIEVQVVDVLKPVFSDLGVIQAVYPNTYSDTDILNMLSASDNYDGDISNQITIINDGYTANSSTVGTYEMNFYVEDSSGNSETYTQIIEVVDNQEPIISGITEIVISYDSQVTENDVMNNLTYTDNYDDQSSLNLVLEEDTYSSNHESLGSYHMTFSVTDSSGNITTQVVTINVVDELGPVMYFNQSIIQTYTDTVMALPDFILLLETTHEIERINDYYVTLRYDSYTRHANIPGVYHVSLNLKDNYGIEINKDFEVRVVERPVDYVKQGENITELNQPIYKKYKEYIIGGSGAALLLTSNIIWVVIFKKKK